MCNMEFVMFFDNASTTKIDEDILDNFKNINNEYFYNPGGLYSSSRNSKKFIEDCRKSILEKLNGDGNLIFTGSASEANNLALFGCLKKNMCKVLVSMGEHPSVYNTALEIKNRGFDVEFVNLRQDGSVDLVDFENKMTSDVGLISIMHVSNETGAINDISGLVEIAKSINPKVIFHCDGVQAVGKIEVDIDDLGVDMYTMSAHKIHGMKGVGALYFKKGISLKPIVFGGGQEQGLRSGTENLLGIYSLSKAIDNSVKVLEENFGNAKELKDIFVASISNSGLDYKINSGDNCSPYIVSVGFAGCRAETLLNMLSDKGVCVGNGSACSAKKMGNRILENMKVSKDYIEGNLRISFSKYNTKAEVNILSNILIEIVKEYLSKVR